MAHKLTAARGADRVLRYTFAEGTSFGNYTFAFTVYDGAGGAACFTAVLAGSGSRVTVAGNVVEVYLDKADIDALPVEAEAGSARICAFDFFATSPDGMTDKVHGGAFVVLPFGAEGTNDVEALTVAIGSVDYDITVAGGGAVLRADNKALSIAVFGAAAVVRAGPVPNPGMRAPFAMQVSEVRASLISASDSGPVQVDVIKNGASMLATPLVIDQGAKTSASHTPPCTLADHMDSLDDDDAITVNVVVPGANATGLTVTLIYRVPA